MAKKSVRQKRHERVSATFNMNLTVNALIGILLAILGTVIMFFGGPGAVESTIRMTIITIGIVIVCLGAVTLVNYFRHKNSANSLIYSICEIVVGIALIIVAATIAAWTFFIIGIVIMVYGVYLLVISRGDALYVLLGIAFLVVGLLIMLYTFGLQFSWDWMNSWGKYVIGSFAYCGAVAFLFF